MKEKISELGWDWGRELGEQLHHRSRVSQTILLIDGKIGSFLMPGLKPRSSDRRLESIVSWLRCCGC